MSSYLYLSPFARYPATPKPVRVPFGMAFSVDKLVGRRWLRMGYASDAAARDRLIDNLGGVCRWAALKPQRTRRLA